MSRKVFVLVAALALSGAGCGSSSNGGASASNPITIQVDGKASGFRAGFLHYYPKAVTVHAGDTIDFRNNFSGEPHTITFGSLADADLAAAAKDKNAEPKLPSLLPEGPGDANQAAANPCVIATGDVPQDGTGCNGISAPFDGTQVFYNSGFLAPDNPVWKLKLADDIKPGTYGYYCLLHGTEMSGTITVVDEKTDADTPDAVAARAKKELGAATAKVTKAVAALKTGALPPFINSAPGQVLAGSGIDDPAAPAILEFGPKEISVPIGGSVTWISVGVHTISFNAPNDAYNGLVKGSDGKYHLNVKLFAPAGGPPAESAPEGPPGPPKITDGGSWDGTGFRNTGAILSFPPNLTGYKLTFTKAGTYGYVCLVHPGMSGTVKVG